MRLFVGKIQRIARLLLWLAPALLCPRGAAADGFVSGHVLVRLQAGQDVTAFASSYGATVLDGIPDLSIYSLSLPGGYTEDQAATLFSGDSRVVWSETDDEISSPELHGKQYHYAFDGTATPGSYQTLGDCTEDGTPDIQTPYAQANVGSANSLSTGAGVIVAVLDTGATFNHPALANNYLPGYNVLNPGQLPWDLPDGVTNTAAGHGTMVAGIIARIAPGAMILPVRVMNGDGVASMLNVAKGLHYAVKAGARVVNMSLGTTRLSDAMIDVIDEARNAQVVMVAAAGNDGSNQILYPALRAGVIAVASVDSNETKSSFSDYGSAIWVSAPGNAIRSTFYDGGFADWSGTSFAAPFVSAEAALIVARMPRWSAGNVAGDIGGTAHNIDTFNPLYHGQLGKGIIDVQAAVIAAR